MPNRKGARIVIHGVKTYKFKGFVISENYRPKSGTYYYTIINDPRGRHHYKTVAEAKRSLTVWEHKQFRRDKPKGWER